MLWYLLVFQLLFCYGGIQQYKDTVGCLCSGWVASKESFFLSRIFQKGLVVHIFFFSPRLVASNIWEEHLVVSDNLVSRPQGPPVRNGLVAPKGSPVVERRSRGLLGALSFHEGGSGGGSPGGEKRPF